MTAHIHHGPFSDALGTKFAKTFCSQCGGKFGPGNGGYSHCRDHATLRGKDDLDLTAARLAMVAALIHTQAHAIRFGDADAEDMRERAGHVQAVLNAVTTYVAAVVEDTAHNSAHLDNADARRAIASMRDAADQFGDATGDLLGPMLNAAEDAEEGRW